MSREGLIIAAVGPDRAGIVDRLSGAIFEQGCNLEDSRMAILGGEFAVIVLVGGAPDRLDEVKRAASKICAELDLVVQFKPTRMPSAVAGAPERIAYRLTAVSLDHPGIVHRITHLLASHNVNVADLETRIGLAPVSGSPIFSLELEAQVPADLPVARLREALRQLSDAENIDIELRAKV
jgi:glycine cleavage system transcriptional repressor